MNIKSIIFISVITAVIRISSALSVNKLLQHSVLELNTLDWFALHFSLNAPPGKQFAVRMFKLSRFFFFLSPDSQRLLGIKVNSGRLQSELKSSTF